MSEEEIVKDTEEKKPEKVGIFRKKSIERISSPEQLHDYIRVTTPSVWLVLIAIIILLVGVVIWAVFGKLELQNIADEIIQIAPIELVTN